MVEFPGGIRGMALNPTDNVGVVTGRPRHQGRRHVKRTGIVEVPSGPSRPGGRRPRQPNGKGPKDVKMQRVEVKAPASSRVPVNEPMQTGLKPSTAAPVGRASASHHRRPPDPKTAVAIDCFINQKSVNAANDPKTKLHQTVVPSEALDRREDRRRSKTTVMEYSSSWPPRLRPGTAAILAPYTAGAMGEYDNGMHAVIVHDDPPSSRRLSPDVAAAPPAGPRGLSGDVFYSTRASRAREDERQERLFAHGPSVIEIRPTTCRLHILTNVISITDGQIFRDEPLLQRHPSGQ